MLNLDDLLLIKKLDQKDVLASIQLLSKQCRQAWYEAQAVNFPQPYKDIDNIVISGMGGSIYGGRIVKSLYEGAIMSKLTIDIVNNYWLPGYVNSRSLVILSSYSGNTEETLAVASQASKKQAKIIGITSGGELSKILKKNGYPCYIFKPIYNPSNQPRIGLGYMVIGLISILAKLKFIPVGEEEIKKLIVFLQERSKLLADNVVTSANLAKNMAIKLHHKLPIFITDDYFAGACHAVRNIFHETAKQFALYFTVPELNHHLLEGLSYPRQLKKIGVMLFVTSDIIDKKNSQRLLLTAEVMEKIGIKSQKINLVGYSGLVQVMEFIQLGAWISFYLAMLNGIDPSTIPYVDYFKKKFKTAL